MTPIPPISQAHRACDEPARNRSGLKADSILDSRRHACLRMSVAHDSGHGPQPAMTRSRSSVLTTPAALGRWVSEPWPLLATAGGCPSLGRSVPTITANSARLRPITLPVPRRPPLDITRPAPRAPNGGLRPPRILANQPMANRCPYTVRFSCIDSVSS
jgi:hypothetical protein